LFYNIETAAVAAVFYFVNKITIVLQLKTEPGAGMLPGLER
jgi:hypothetical protein